MYVVFNVVLIVDVLFTVVVGLMCVVWLLCVMVCVCVFNVKHGVYGVVGVLSMCVLNVG